MTFKADSKNKKTKKRKKGLIQTSSDQLKNKLRAESKHRKTNSKQQTERTDSIHRKPDLKKMERTGKAKLFKESRKDWLKTQKVGLEKNLEGLTQKTESLS